LFFEIEKINKENCMKKITLFILLALAAAFFTACGAPAGNSPAANNANAANANAAKPVAAAPTKDALMTLEKSAYEAWKTKDAKFWDTFLTDNFVGFGAAGRLDRAAAIKQYSGADCDVKSYALSDEQMTAVGADAAFITYKATYDGTCGGQKLPAQVWAAGVYVRSGDKWKGAFHAETPVVDPKAPPAKAAAPAPAKKDEAKPAETKSDTLTESLMAIETKGWEAWKQRDKAGVESVMAKDFMYFSGLGRTARADAIKLWAEQKCTGLDYKFSDPMGLSVTPDVSLVTYKADVKGKCDGKPVAPSLWVASFDLKEGDAWKNAFYADVPR
jgi:hypothetical protein